MPIECSSYVDAGLTSNVVLYFLDVFRMDLLDSVLRKAKAENFAEKFKANGINTTTLSLLTDEDLQLLDINNPDIRQEILKCIENLQIPKEYVCLEKKFNFLIRFFYRRKNELLIDQEYVVTVLHCIGQQLLLHYASLSYAMTVENLIICDVKLLPATRCLVNSIQGLEQKLNTLEELVLLM